MRLKRNYYEVMGLTRNATSLEVKKKYHDLVRQFHPDRATDKEMATRLFSQINQAYRTLIDDTRRQLYDANLQSEELGAARQAMRGPGSSFSVPQAPQPAFRPAVAYQTPPRPASSTYGEQIMDGRRPQPAPGPTQAHRPAPQPQAAPKAPPQPQPRPARPTPTAPLNHMSGPQPVNEATMRQWMDEATRAYFANDRDTAGVLVNRLLKHDAKYVDALRLAGDIFADTGRRKEAVTAYTKALALQGSNLMLQEKIARLKAALVAESGGQDLSAKRAATSSAEPKVEEEKPSLLRRILGGSTTR